MFVGTASCELVETVYILVANVVLAKNTLLHPLTLQNIAFPCLQLLYDTLVFV